MKRRTAPPPVEPEQVDPVLEEAISAAARAVEVPSEYDTVQLKCPSCGFLTDAYNSKDVAEGELAEHIATVHRNDIGHAIEEAGGPPWCDHCRAPERPTRDGIHRCQCRTVPVKK